MKKGSPSESKPPALQLRCEACNATVEAACGCGVAYVPAGKLAERAVKAYPRKSNRAIARELGIDHKTVGGARKKAGEEYSPTEKRTGLDGKSYPPTKPIQLVIKEPAAVLPDDAQASLFASLLDDLRKAVELARDPAADTDDPLVRQVRGLGERLTAAKLMPLDTFISQRIS